MTPPASELRLPRSRAGRRLDRRAALGGLLAVHAALLVWGSRSNFAGSDEAAHIVAGVAHWRTGTLHTYRVNPPLVDLISALPVLAAAPRVDFRQLDHCPLHRPEWNLGSDFAAINGERYMTLLRLARLPIVVWSLLGALVIARWADLLWGRPAGLFAAALWCFSPTVLAWGQALTNDVAAASAGVAATYVFWTYLRRPSWSLALAAGASLGVAELTKFTMLVLYPTWLFLWLAARPKVRATFGQATAIVGISFFVLNLGYGFQGSGRRLGDFTFVSRTFSGAPDPGPTRSPSLPGNRFLGTWAASLPVPVPSDYLQGIDIQRKDFEGGLDSYLAGEWSREGWIHYYLYAFLVKEPIGSIALLAWSLALMAAAHPACGRPFDEWATLLPAAALFSLVSSQTGFNHHFRYVLPALPFLFISAGKLAYFFRPGHRIGCGLVLVLLAASIVSSLSVFPHSISYFNEAAGGPEQGHRHLANDNIDWGQDLLGLRDWIDAHPQAQPLGLAYYGLIDPRIVGIEFTVPPPGRPADFPDDPELSAHFGPQPGYYAVSVNFLSGSKYFLPDGRGSLQPIRRRDYFHYFRDFQPIARAGYSIYIYQITRIEAAAARRKQGLPPLPPEPVQASLASLEPQPGSIDPAARHCLETVVPTLSSRRDADLSDMLHLLHLNGVSAKVSVDGPPQEASILELLLDSERWSRFIPGTPPLVKTRRGARFSLRDPTLVGVAQRGAETHPGQTLAVLGGLGIPLDRPIRLPGGFTGTLRMLVNDLISESTLQGEIDWQAVALAFYLPPRRAWRNRLGEEFTFDDVGRELLARSPESSPCAGIHRLIALVIIHRVNERTTILSPWIALKIAEELGKTADYLVRTQSIDGSWTTRWYRGLDLEDQRLIEDLSDAPSSLVSTGHHLEWLTLLPESMRPPDACLSRATHWLVAALRSRVAPGERLPGRDFCAAVHAARSIQLWNGR